MAYFLVPALALLLNQRVASLEWQTKECEAFRKELPSDFVQDFVEVPEDWDDPKSEPIRVFYYGRLDPKQTPVAYFNGGPVYSSHAKFRDFAAVPGLAGKAVIFMDQRGTGCSTPLPEAKRENMPRFRKYGSRAIVRDAEKIREKLSPGKPWVIFGNSYGGLIVRRYLEIAPDGVERAVSHGFAATATAWSLQAGILAAARVQKEFSARHPGGEDDLKSLRAYMRDHCYESPVRRICGNDQVKTLAIAMSYVSEWPRLADDLRRFANANDDAKKKAYQSLGKDFFLEDLRPTPEINWATQVIGDLEVTPASSDCGEAYRALRGRIDPADVVFHSCGSVFEEWLGYAPLPPDPLRMDVVRANLDRRPGLMFKIYGGRLDAIIPPEVFAEEAKILGPRAPFKTLPDSGHDGYHTEQEVLEAAFGPLKGRRPGPIRPGERR